MIDRFARVLTIGLGMLIGVAILLFVVHCAATISADEPRVEWIPYDAVYVGWDMTTPEPEPQAPPTPVAFPDGSDIASLVHAGINEQRAEQGLGPLEWLDTIAPFGQAHTNDMAAYDYFSHSDRDGRDFAARWADWEHDECLMAGENLSKSSYGIEQAWREGYQPDETASHMVEGWMTSEGHRANILTPEYTHTAIAVAIEYSPSGEKNYAWAAQIFCQEKSTEITLAQVFADITLTCTDENDLTITLGENWLRFGREGQGPDVWSKATWGAERGIGGEETLVLMIGDDYYDGGFGGGVADYTIYNYISAKPPFHYDITLEAYIAQVEGEPVILDKGTPLEREASRGELFYPGEHGIEPVATHTFYHFCDVE